MLRWFRRIKNQDTIMHFISAGLAVFLSAMLWTVTADCASGTIDVLGACMQCQTAYTGCARGSYQAADGQCTACSAGSVSYFINATRCFACSEYGDSSQPNVLQSECECAVGSFYRNKTTCTKCVPGLVTSKPNSAQCSLCAGNAVANAAQSACDCPAGSAWTNTTTGMFNCTSCGPNEVSTPNAAACVVCDPARHLQANVDRTGCECMANQLKAEDGRSCYCPKGYYIADGGACIRCQTDGVSLSVNSNSCMRCPMGVPNANQDGCTCNDANTMLQYTGTADGWRCLCKANYYQPMTTGSLCTACPSNSFNNGWARNKDDTGSCKTCKPRQTKATETDGYQQCECTKPFIAGVTGVGENCVCSAGFYLTTNTTCAKCAAGFYSKNQESTNCTACSGSGQVVNAAQTDCICKTHYRMVNATTCECPPGFYLSGEVCNPCASNWISTTPNAAACTQCQLGQRSNQAQTACVSTTLSSACPAGSYVNDTNNCNPCPAGTISSVANSTSCAECVPDTSQSSAVQLRANNQQTQCICPIQGTVEAEGGSCLCPTGFVLRTNAQSFLACTACPSGTTSDPEFENYCTSVEPCRSGSYLYQNDTAMTRTCQQCPNNSVSVSGNTTTCTPCGAGMTPNAGHSACICADSSKTLQGSTCVCKPGTYVDANGDCQSCPYGMVSIQPASATCSRCPNQLIPAANQASCLCPGDQQLMCGTGECFCPIGWYKDAGSAFQCKLCPTGKTTTRINTLSCVDATAATPATSLLTTQHTSTSKFSLKFNDLDYNLLSQDQEGLDAFKQAIADIIIRSTNTSAERVTVANMRSGSVVADVYISDATATLDDLTKTFTTKMPTLIANDAAFKTFFGVKSSPAVMFVAAQTNTPDADALAAAAAASKAMANKAGMIVGIEVAGIVVIGAGIGYYVIRRRRRAAAALMPHDMQNLLEVRTDGQNQL